MTPSAQYQREWKQKNPDRMAEYRKADRAKDLADWMLREMYPRAYEELLRKAKAEIGIQ